MILFEVAYFATQLENRFLTFSKVVQQHVENVAGSIT